MRQKFVTYSQFIRDSWSLYFSGYLYRYEFARMLIVANKSAHEVGGYCILKDVKYCISQVKKMFNIMHERAHGTEKETVKTLADQTFRLLSCEIL